MKKFRVTALNKNGKEVSFATNSFSDVVWMGTNWWKKQYTNIKQTVWNKEEKRYK